MKRLFAGILAFGIMLSLPSAFCASAAEQVSLVAPKKTAQVDGTIGSGEWDGAPSITINSETAEVTNLAEGVTPGGDVTSKLSFMYDDTYLYILEERSSNYLYTEFDDDLANRILNGDSTQVYLSVYRPDLDLSVQKMLTSDVQFSYDSKDGRSEGRTIPMIALRSLSFDSAVGAFFKNDNQYQIKSTIDAERKNAVTEVAVRWTSLFQGHSEYRDKVQSIIQDGLAIKIGAVVNVGNSTARLQYSYSWGINEESLDGWSTLYLNQETDGQIEAAYNPIPDSETNQSFPWNIVIIVVVIVAVIVIGVVIVFRIFGLSFHSEEVEEDDEDEEEEEESDEESDEDESEEDSDGDDSDDEA